MMTKKAIDIKIGDTVRGEHHWVKVKIITNKIQKNGKKLVCVIGDRIFKNDTERNGVLKTWGDSALEGYSEYRELTNVQFK